MDGKEGWYRGVRRFSLRADLDGKIFLYDCSMRCAHVTSTTRIVLSKSDVQHLHDSCTQHEKCRRILKHVSKPYDSRSHNQNVRMTSCIRSLLDASSARYKSRIPRRQSQAKVVSKTIVSRQSFGGPQSSASNLSTQEEGYPFHLLHI